MTFTLTVIIATYNRPELVKRAVASAAAQAEQVIVVNDGSNLHYDCDAITAGYNNVLYIELPSNSGVQYARNAGLDACRTDLALVLDDDDILRDGACEMVRGALQHFPAHHKFPVYNFSTSNGHFRVPFDIANVTDYLDGGITGDFSPVFLVDHVSKPRYPALPLRVGVEHMMWWALAEDFGIPTWASLIVVDTSPDAAVRLTSPVTFVKKAREFAVMQSVTLKLMQDRTWDIQHPRAYRKRAHATLLYALCANELALVAVASEALGYNQKFTAFVANNIPRSIWCAALYVLKRIALRKTHKA